MSEEFLYQLEARLKARREAGEEHSYTASLFAAGENHILRKFGEEAIEVVLAAKAGGGEELVHEVADLWYHTLVLLGWHKLSLQQVIEELQRRQYRSGLEEKASRASSRGEE